jgi:PhnB protein
MDDLYVRLVYEDEQAAAEWLTKAFGFQEVTRKTDPSGSAIIWLELSGGTIMISRTGYGLESPNKLGGVSHKMNVYVADVDAHHAQAIAAGAVIERPLETVPYGERRYEVFDPDGHRWHFTQRL